MYIFQITKDHSREQSYLNLNPKVKIELQLTKKTQKKNNNLQIHDEINIYMYSI